ncbi:MAG: hypothetical protein KJ077_14620 [Anaerolineae bacterium]|nr:hypothetical protein [Anaerolineae bacterium]
MQKQLFSTVVILAVLTILGGYIVHVAGAELAASVVFIIRFATYVVATGLVLTLIAWGWIIFERARAERERRLEAQARRQVAERESKVMVVKAKWDEQVFIRDQDKEVNWRPAHLDQRLYANGQATMPSHFEVASWAAWQQSRRPTLSASGEEELPLALDSGPLPTSELPSLVRWADLIPQQQGDMHNLVLGVRLDEAGQPTPVTISLYELFHTIVAASTGWGKSVFVSAILAQLATCPDAVEFVLIDQQDHGLSAFKQCDRLRYPLLRQADEILSALYEVHEEATQYRSALFARYDADDLAEYNRLTDHYLPPIVVVVEEASALLGNKEIGAALKKHAWELRKFGVYQFLMLTSAKGTTIDTDHRQQFASKVQLHANERGQARLLIDAPEAITFPPGRAVIDLPGQMPTIVQTPYIDKRELRALLHSAGAPPSRPLLSGGEHALSTLSEAEKDQLFKRRVQDGLSRNAASLEVYGRRYAGDLVERGKRALGEL